MEYRTCVWFINFVVLTLLGPIPEEERQLRDKRKDLLRIRKSHLHSCKKKWNQGLKMQRFRQKHYFLTSLVCPLLTYSQSEESSGSRGRGAGSSYCTGDRKQTTT